MILAASRAHAAEIRLAHVVELKRARARLAAAGSSRPAALMIPAMSSDACEWLRVRRLAAKRAEAGSADLARSEPGGWRSAASCCWACSMSRRRIGPGCSSRCAEHGGVAAGQLPQDAGEQPRVGAGQGEQDDLRIGGGEDGSQRGVVELQPGRRMSSQRRLWR